MATRSRLTLLILFNLAGLCPAVEERPAFCNLSAEVGPCNDKTDLIFYNPETQRCEQFVYGGCGGNENRFLTIGECHQTCAVPNETQSLGLSQWLSRHVKHPHCLEPAETGPFHCRGAFPKFTFNAAVGKCQKYLYGGCRGTANLYSSKEECISSCVYKYSVETDDFIMLRSSIFLEADDNPEDEDDKIIFPGFPLKEDQGDQDICRLPPVEPGTTACSIYRRTWTYDWRIGECMEITNGGCRGTENQFSSMEDCQRRCGASKSNLGKVEIYEGDVCLLPPITPPGRRCRGYNPKYTFNSERGECIKYIYGGCSGTANLFDTQEDCQRKCANGRPPFLKTTAVSSDDRCQLPPVRPSFECQAALPRFTFDSAAGECRRHLYGGCGATANLYRTEEDCLAACQPELLDRLQDICALPMDSGDCNLEHGKAYSLAYGFNHVSKRCERFKYSGCGGNANRFSSQSECVNNCGGFEPLQTAACSAISHCDKNEERFFRAKACDPVYRPGECCPAAWDCSRWEQRLLDKSACFAANEKVPGGKYYSPGELMDEIDQGCTLACRCGRVDPTLGYPTATCASVDCPPRRIAAPLAGEDQHCRATYGRKDDCCHQSFKCGQELTGSCLFEGNRYHHGEKMYSKEDPCKVCLCGEGFNEEAFNTINNNRDYCYEIDCFGAWADRYLILGCQPVHKPGRCCPVDWICPPKEQEEDDEYEDVPLLEEVSADCPPGSDFIGGESDLIPNNSSDVCLLPPAKGPCSGFADKWAFNMDSRACKQFVYGGIVNSGNVFDSEADCRLTCHQFMLSPEEEDQVMRKRKCAKPPITPQDEGSVLCRPRKVFNFDASVGKCVEVWSRVCHLQREDFFATLEECNVSCLKSPSVSNERGGKADNKACWLPVKPGLCRSRLQRFYYDPASGVCRPFWYTGCRGNSNNFEDAASCAEACMVGGRTNAESDLPSRGVTSHNSLDVRDPCKQPKEVGPCKAKALKWFFDDTKKSCRLFFFSGCGGNANRFNSLVDCTRACPVDRQLQGKLRRGTCTMPVDRGPCRALLRRFFYDEVEGSCQPFFYGGCRGNDNNFETREECALNCEMPVAATAARTPKSKDNHEGSEHHASRSSSVDPCMLDSEVGFCRAAFTKFYFDRTDRACKSFIYGGCLGNANNFVSKEHCEKVCHIHLPKSERTRSGPLVSEALSAADVGPCSHPVDSGPCLTPVTLWFFDGQECTRFFYGGCAGNDNRFESKEECEAACVNRGGNTASKKEPKCIFGYKSYSLGDIIFKRSPGEDRCFECVCRTPPGLSCTRKENCTD